VTAGNIIIQVSLGNARTLLEEIDKALNVPVKVEFVELADHANAVQ